MFPPGGSATPIFRGAPTEWSPIFGASWQRPHVETMLAGPVTPLEKVVPFSPATPEMVNVLVLNTICCCAALGPGEAACACPRVASRAWCARSACGDPG